MLQACCSGLKGLPPLVVPAGRRADPVVNLLQWVTAAMSGSIQQQEECSTQQQEQEQQQQREQVHPAEVLRQVLDVLLSALQYRHVLSMCQ
jgi:hypothetical protein